MVLSNAERQKRHREKIRALADAGVTPEMIVEAAKVIYEREASDPLNRLGTWPEFLAECSKRGKRGQWIEILPTFALEEDEDFVRETYGDNADLLLKVSAVVRAVTIPPATEKA